MIVLLVIFLLSPDLFSQRLNFGITWKPPLTTIYNLRVNQDGVYPNFSYRTYKVNDRQQLSYNALNWGLGFLVGLDYSRIKITGEANFNFGFYSYTIDYPVAPGKYLQHIADMKGWYVDFPVVVGYSFFNSKYIRLYLEAGGSYAKQLDMMELNNDESQMKEFNDNIFQGLFYTDEYYFNAVGGIGIYSTVIAATFRYYERLTGLPENFHIGYFVLNLQINVSFSNLRKHYIYID